MTHVTLRQLQVFEAVARHSSFTRAANRLHVTQPTVSKQIRALSDAIGAPLIEQIGKKVYLTELGRELYATCASWLETWERFEQTIAEHKGLKRGRLRIAAVTTAKYFMPRIIGPFCAQYPGIDVALEVVNRDRLLDRLARNQDDVYIMGVPPAELDTECAPFMANRIVIIAPRDHPLAQRRRVSFKQIAASPFIVREQGSGTRMALEREFARHKARINVRMELGSNEAIKQAVIGGLGIAVLSESALNDSRVDEISILPVAGFPLRRAWYTVYPRGKRLSIVATTFLEFLREHIELLGPAARQP